MIKKHKKLRKNRDFLKLALDLLNFDDIMEEK